MSRKGVNSQFWVIKNSMIGLLMLIILYKASGLDRWLHDYRIYGISPLSWLFGYLGSFCMAYLLHLFVFIKVKNSKPNQRVPIKELHSNWFFKTFLCFLQDNEGQTRKASTRWDSLKGTVLKLVSPDFSSANTFKVLLWNDKLNPVCPIRTREVEVHRNKSKTKFVICKNQDNIYECEFSSKKNRRKDFILYSNWVNVIIACLFCAFSIFTYYNDFFKALIIFHILSRIVEIVFAFYSDVVRVKMSKSTLSFGYKSSSLKRANRISLAIHSYFEIVLLYGATYAIFAKYINDILSTKSTSFLDFILYSISVSAYNFSLDLTSTTLGKVLHVSQVFVSMTLIVLSVATYIGMKDDMSDIEIMEWEDEEYI